jgi:hypothetical protein
MRLVTTLDPILRQPTLARLRDLSVGWIDQLWFAAAVALGLVLSYWLCATLGLPSPLTPLQDLFVL